MGGTFHPLPSTRMREVVLKRVVMGEVFGGTCVLTHAVQALGLRTMKPWDLWDPTKTVKTEVFDSLDPECQKRLEELI